MSTTNGDYNEEDVRAAVNAALSEVDWGQRFAPYHKARVYDREHPKHDDFVNGWLGTIMLLGGAAMMLLATIVIAAVILGRF